MLRWFMVFLLLISALGAAPQTQASAVAPGWVIWLDGNHYVPDWSVAMEGILRVIKPGDLVLVRLAGREHRFVRQPGSGQHKEMMGVIRSGLVQGAHRITQLAQELAHHSRMITSGQELNSIKAYLFGRKQLLDLYGESQRGFWQNLEQGLLAPGTRMVVLIQQFDVPSVDGQTLRNMMEGRLRDWVGDLSQATPWEETPEAIGLVIEKAQASKNRIDCFYLKTHDRPVDVGIEVSKAFFRGISRLGSQTGGVCQNLNTNLDEIVTELKR